MHGASGVADENLPLGQNRFAVAILTRLTFLKLVFRQPITLPLML